MKRTSLKVEDFAVVYSGGTPSTSNGAFWDGGIPWITPKDLAGYEARHIASGERDISDEGLRNSSARLLPEETVLLTTRAPIGYVALASVPLATNQGFKNLVCKPNLAVPDFVYYLLKHSTALLESHATGATFKEVSGSRLKAIEFQLPDTASQQRIADILATYDNLIEINRRRMALLEEAARQLYREWFVRLRFPGHEHTSITKSVPEGWDTQLLDDLCHIGRGASPRPIAAFMGGDVPWFKIGDATASESPFILRTEEYVTQDGAKKSIMLEPGALILSNSATCGIPYFTAVAGCIHDGWLHFSDLKRLSRQFLYCFLYFKREELVSSVGDGSTQKNLNTAAVGRLKLTLPRSDSLLIQFDETVAFMFTMVLNLATQNEGLRAARDLLLPRLISGEIAV